MVSKKSKPAATRKLTYRQRTLYSIFDLQKEYPRKAFHVATVKTHVKKAAAKKNDKLGPSWNRFVAKAIHRLIEEGILMERSRNYVELSPASKKKNIVEVKRAAIDLEKIAAKHLPSGSDFVPGRKRLADYEIDATPAKKARRTTSGTIHSPLNKMRKPELIKMVERLQAKYDQQGTPDSTPSRRSLSPLTDLDEDETGIMDIDISETMQPENTIPGSNEPLQRTVSFAAATPARVSNGLAQQTSSRLGLTRTESGSYISDLSKQATPPPESDGAGMDYSNDNSSVTAVDGELVSFNENEACQDQTALMNHGLATPKQTPSRPTSLNRYHETPVSLPTDQELPSRQKIDFLHLQLKRIEEDNERLQAAGSAHLSTISNLNHEIETLQQNNVDAENRVVELEMNVDSSNAQTADLQVQLHSATTSVQTVSGILRQKNDELDQLHNTLNRAQESARVYQDSLEDAQVELDQRSSQITSLRTLIFAAEAQAEELRSEINNSKTASAQLQAQLDQTAMDKERLMSELGTERGRYDLVQRTLQEAIERETRLQEDVNELRELRDEDEKTIQKLKDDTVHIMQTQLQQFMNNAQQASPAKGRRSI